jgi:hypothetical protein
MSGLHVSGGSLAKLAQAMQTVQERKMPIVCRVSLENIKAKILATSPVDPGGLAIKAAAEQVVLALKTRTVHSVLEGSISLKWLLFLDANLGPLVQQVLGI